MKSDSGRSSALTFLPCRVPLSFGRTSSASLDACQKLWGDGEGAARPRLKAQVDLPVLGGVQAAEGGGGRGLEPLP